MALSEAAKAARSAYTKEWKRKNRDKVNAAQQRWRAKNPEKEREYHERYWERKAMKMFGK